MERQAAHPRRVGQRSDHQNRSKTDSEGYGYLFWAGPEGSFRADGKYGQFVILMRDKNAVVTVTAESRDAGALLRAVFEEIYPQL